MPLPLSVRIARSRAEGAAARFENALQLVVEGGQADHHRHQVLLRQFAQQVEVAKDQRALGDDGQRVTEAQQHLQHLAGQAAFAFQRLVGVGIGTQVDRRAAIAGLAQFLLQRAGDVALGDQPGLEIDPRREVPIGMAGPRIAVDAAMLATTVGIDRAIEREVRRLVAGDHRAGDLLAHLGELDRRHVLLPAIVEGLAVGRGEAVEGVAGGTATARGQGSAHEGNPAKYCIWIQYRTGPRPTAIAAGRRRAVRRRASSSAWDWGRTAPTAPSGWPASARSG